MAQLDRTEHLKEIAEVLEKYGNQDIRAGQAIYNAMHKTKCPLYSIENKDLLKLLKEGL